jgi:hypothetical protein
MGDESGIGRLLLKSRGQEDDVARLDLLWQVVPVNEGDHPAHFTAQLTRTGGDHGAEGEGQANEVAQSNVVVVRRKVHVTLLLTRTACTGRRTMKVAPLPGSLITSISPPCWWTICWLVASPRPVP